MFGWALLVLGWATPAFAEKLPPVDEGHISTPAFSPDGWYLAFETNDMKRTVNFYLAKLSGDIIKDHRQVGLTVEATQFKKKSGVLGDPSWHPDGVVLLGGGGAAKKMRIFMYHPSEEVAVPLFTLKQSPGNLSSPSVSPDGETIAFVSDETGHGDLKTWNRRTNLVVRYTDTKETESSPQFSKDGRHLTFTRKIDNTLDIIQLEMAKRKETAVADGFGDQTRPTHAAGKNVVFFTSEKAPNTWDLATVNGPRNANKRILARGVRLPDRARPAISPDGEWVAFTFDDPSKGDDVWLTRIDGTKTVKIPTPYRGCGEPALGKQAGRIMLAFTALRPDDSDWRLLHVQDITDELAQ